MPLAALNFVPEFQDQNRRQTSSASAGSNEAEERRIPTTSRQQQQQIETGQQEEVLLNRSPMKKKISPPIAAIGSGRPNDSGCEDLSRRSSEPPASAPILESVRPPLPPHSSFSTEDNTTRNFEDLESKMESSNASTLYYKFISGLTSSAPGSGGPPDAGSHHPQGGEETAAPQTINQNRRKSPKALEIIPFVSPSMSDENQSRSSEIINGDHGDRRPRGRQSQFNSLVAPSFRSSESSPSTTANGDKCSIATPSMTSTSTPQSFRNPPTPSHPPSAAAAGIGGGGPDSPFSLLSSSSSSESIEAMKRMLSSNHQRYHHQPHQFQRNHLETIQDAEEAEVLTEGRGSVSAADKTDNLNSAINAAAAAPTRQMILTSNDSNNGGQNVRPTLVQTHPAAAVNNRHPAAGSGAHNNNNNSSVATGNSTLDQHNNYVANLATQLQRKINLFESYMSTLLSKEQLLNKDMQTLEMEKLSVKNQEVNVRRERNKLETDRLDFEERKDRELKEIKKVTQDVEKRKTLVSKKETEQIKLLKEEVADLQNEIIERDTRLSGLRLSLKETQQSNSKLKMELETANLDLDRLKERTRTLEDINAQLRVKLGGAAAKQAAAAESGPKYVDLNNINRKTVSSSNLIDLSKSAQVGRTKSVRFDLKENSNPATAERWEPNRDYHYYQNQPHSAATGAGAGTTTSWERTDDAGTQTSLLYPNSPAAQPLQSMNGGNGGIVNNNTPADTVSTNAHLPTLLEEKDVGNGRTELLYSNGLTVINDAVDQSQTWCYANGDTRKCGKDGTETYYYADKGIATIKQPDGVMITRFNDGHEERILPDGTKEIRQGNCLTRIHPTSGRRTEEWDNGTKKTYCTDENTVETVYADGSREIKTDTHVRRVFPSGDEKLLWSDGRVETRYVSGRVRIKDKTGAIISDSAVVNPSVAAASC